MVGPVVDAWVVVVVEAVAGSVEVLVVGVVRGVVGSVGGLVGSAEKH